MNGRTWLAKRMHLFRVAKRARVVRALFNGAGEAHDVILMKFIDGPNAPMDTECTTVRMTNYYTRFQGKIENKLHELNC